MTTIETEEISALGATLVLRREPWDCEQLELEAGKVERLTAVDLAGARAVLAEALVRARRRGLLHLASRVDSQDRLSARALQATGFGLVDTVVNLSLSLSTAAALLPPRLPGGAVLRWATPADAAALGRLSADAFADPTASFNRYLNDGRFTEAQVRRVYETWARTSVGGAAADATIVAARDEMLLGFLTVKRPGSDGVGRVPLNAVAGSARGQGIYQAMVIEAARDMVKRGAQRLDVTTQIQQLAVQRTWWKLGAIATSSAYSFHRWLDD